MLITEALDILELDRSTSLEMIKKAYKRLARNYHPDNKATRDKKMFLKIKEAYEYLKISEIAKKWRIKERRINTLCSEGWIEGTRDY